MADRIDKKEWYRSGHEDEGYFASSVCIYRNFEDANFIGKLDAKGAETVLERVKSAADKDKTYGFADFDDYFNGKYQFYDKIRFAEEWKVSKGFLDSDLPRALVTDEQNLFVSVNDTEHLTIKALFTGDSLKEAYDCAKEFEQLTPMTKKYAFTGEFGYLMRDPSLVGTGLKASIVLHIPAICHAGAFEEFDDIMAGRGIEVSKPFGDAEPNYTGLIKISNAASIDASDREIINNLCEAAAAAVEIEKKCENEIMKTKLGNIDDMAWRALGTLRYARSISFKEAVRCLSLVHFGIRNEIITGIEPFGMAEIVFTLHHAGLCKATGKTIEASDDNEARADYLRKLFNE